MDLTWGGKLHQTQLSVKRKVAPAANDLCAELPKILRMTQLAHIHANKRPIRIHYIKEWAKKRGLKQVDVVRGVGTDKSTVSRWFKGSLPTEPHLLALTGLFELDDISALFRHPDDDWLSRFFKDRSAEERERAVQVLELAFPRTGTRG